MGGDKRFLLLPGGEGEASDLTNNDADGVATIVGSANFRPVTWTVRSEADGSLTLVSGPDDVDPEAVGYGQGFGINAQGDVCGEFGFVGSTEGYSAVRAWNGGSLEILGQLNERQPDDGTAPSASTMPGKPWAGMVHHQARQLEAYRRSVGRSMARPRSW